MYNPGLQGLRLADNSHSHEELNIDILICADFYWYFVSGNLIRGPQPGPIALSTKLGYVLSGPVKIPVLRQGFSTVNLRFRTASLKKKNSLEEKIKHFWDLETLGIKHDELTVYEKFIEGIKHSGERYKVKLPFKEVHPLLPDNCQLSKMRLEPLLRLLKLKQAVLKHYDEVIQEQLGKNIIEPVNMDKRK